MTILFICFTYMQLITAVQIKIRLFPNANADLVLTNDSVNADSVCNNLGYTHLFEHVSFCQENNIGGVSHTLHEKIRNIRIRLFGTSSMIDRLNLFSNTYDFIFYYNPYNILTQYFYDQSIRLGKVPELCGMEEGILSYQSMIDTRLSGRLKIVFELRKIAKNDKDRLIPSKYYCFYPELLREEKIQCVQIPTLSREDDGLIELLNDVFQYDHENDSYPQKYIFFASSTDIDGKPVGETELVLQISEQVGKENLLVKMHPRDGRKVYEEKGISVSRNSSIPWEVIQLNHDFTNHVFLTISSGSVLNASAMLGDNIRTLFLYPLLPDQNSVAVNTVMHVDDIPPMLEQLKQVGLLSSVGIAQQMSDILNL